MQPALADEIQGRWVLFSDELLNKRVLSGRMHRRGHLHLLSIP